MEDSGQQGSIRINHAKLPDNARPAVFAVVNAIATSLTDMERAYRMRPAELQLFLLIGLAGAQRALRERPLSAELASMAPMPMDKISGISRRQLAELTGLSREAVRRAVLRLMERGEVMEKERGLLSHTPASFQRLNALLPMADFLRPFVTMMNELEQLNAIKVRRST